MANLKFFLRYWLPVVAWLAVIFSASSDAQSYEHSGVFISKFFEPVMRWFFPTLSPARLDELHHLFRKCGHLTEFAILALLLWRALRHSLETAPRRWHWPAAGLALAGVFLYAASDEFHQSFVPGRTALISDMFIDTAGGAVGLLLLWSTGKIFQRW